MTEDTHQKSSSSLTRWQFVGRSWGDIVRGFVPGALAGYIAPTFIEAASKIIRRTLTWANSHWAPLAVWPKHGTLTILIALSVFGLFCLIRIIAFSRRAWVSWRAGLISGLALMWFLASGVTFTVLNLTGSFFAVFILAVGVAATVATFERNLKLEEGSAGISQPDPDEPISKRQQDILGRDAVVASIVRAVVEDRAPIIALTGAFGDGKTSVLNLLSRALEGRKEVMCVRFSTWLPMDEKTLVSTLLGTVLAKIEKRLLIPEIKRDLATFTRLLFAVLPRVPAALLAWVEKPSQDQRIAELQRNLSRLPIRVAILLDDMDRMRRKELEALFKLLRGVPDLPQFAYVCAFDRRSLVQTLRSDGSEKSREEAEHFLEKFFPDEIPLPKIEGARLAVEFENKFYAICDGSKLITDPAERQKFKDEFRQLWERHLKSYFGNLRRVKLFTNRLNRSLPLVNEEVNLRDFVLLEMVRMINPVLYEEIYRNGRYFMFPEWRVNTWLQIVSLDEEEQKRKRREYFDNLFKGLPRPPEGVVLALLEEIFPSVDAYIGDKDIPGSVSGDQDKAQRERRIYHPDFFPRYFIFNVPTDLFGERELSIFIAAINEKNDLSRCAEMFKAKYAELAELPMKRWDFLRRILSSIQRFNPVATRALIAGISELSDSLEKSEAAGSFDAMTAMRIVFGAVNSLQSDEGAQAVLVNVIRNASSDLFATKVLNESVSRSHRLLEHGISVEKEAVERAFRERMNARYTAGGHSSILSRERQNIAPLGRWALCGAEGREQVHTYLREEFLSAPSKIGRFLSYFFPAQNGPPGIDPLAAIKTYFPVEELRQLLNEHGDSATSSPEESDAIREFRTRYEKGSSSGNSLD
jgi:predicted KAP-like P-loop ATPase